MESRLKSLFHDSSVTHKILKECWDFLKMTVVVIVQISSQLCFVPILVAIIGHLGETELAAISLSGMIFNTMFVCINRGMGTGGDTYLAQAYGRGQKRLLGTLVQRSIIVHVLSVFLLLPFYYNVEYILVGIGIDPEISRITGEFIMWIIPGAFVMQVFTVLIRYLVIRNQFTASMIFGTAQVLLGLVFAIFTCRIMEFGVWTAAVGLSLSWVLCVALLLAWIVYEGSYKEYWPGLHWPAFGDLWNFSMHCFNATIVMFVDWGSYEMIVLLSGTLGTRELAVQGVIYNILTIFMVCPTAICIATALQVGNALGSAKANKAIRFMRISYATTVFQLGVSAALMIGLKEVLPLMFTSSEEIIETSAPLMVIMASLQAVDSLMFTGRGLQRGTGRLRVGLVASVITFGVIGLPLACYLLLRTSLEVFGGWLGLTCAIGLCSLFYIVYFTRYVDWEILTLEATERIKLAKGLASTTLSPISSFKREDVEMSGLSNGVTKAQSDEKENLGRRIHMKNAAVVGCLAGLFVCISVVTNHFAELPISVSNSTMEYDNFTVTVSEWFENTTLHAM